MRAIILSILLILFLSPQLGAQKKRNGAEVRFSLRHPAKWSQNEYKFSTDPTLELLWFTSVSEQFILSGGLFSQFGEHNWLELTGHTFTDQYGVPFPVRTDYSRRLKFLSLGIPLKLERIFRNSFIHSFFMGVTGGKHVELSLDDYLKSTHIAELEPGYNSFFWELNLGIRKNLYQTGGLQILLSPETGFRKNSSEKSIGGDNYLFYGLGVTALIGK